MNRCRNGMVSIAIALVLSVSTWAQESSTEAKGAYADAANLQNAGNFDVAAIDWQKFLDKYPKDPLAPKAQHYLGVCYLQQKKYPEAIAAFDAVQKNNPKFDLIEDVLLNLGWCHYTLAGQGDAKQFPQAIEAFDALLKQNPKGKYVDQALYFRGESFYQQGKKAEAVASYEQLIKEHEKSSLRCDALYALGVAQEELTKYAEAGATYDLFLKECEKSDLITEVRMRKAETILQKGDYAAAEKTFGEVAAVPNFALADHALFREAFCLTKLDRFNEAGALYAKIVDTYPKSERVNIADAVLAAGRCFYRGDNLPEAAKWLDKTLTANPPAAPEAAHWLARVHLRDKKPADAEAIAAKYAAMPGDYQAALLMDQADAVYETTDRKAESIALYAKVAKDHAKSPLAPQALYNAAYASLDTKKFEEGLKFAAEFVKSFPEDKLLAEVKYVQAECLMQTNKPAEAAAIYKELTSKNATHAEIDVWRVRLALAMYLQKEYAEVVAFLTPLVPGFKTPEQKAEALYMIGVSQFYVDKLAEARDALTQSLTTAPKWRQADETLLVLSRVQRKLDQTKEAIVTVNKLITDFPTANSLDQAHYRLGEYLYAGDDFKGAAAEYDAVVAKWPTSAFVPYALYGKGWSQLKLKDFSGATLAFTTLLAKHPQHALSADAYFARALSRREEKDFPGAIEDLEAFLKSNPSPDKRSDALYERGLAEVGLKKFDAAVATFEELLKTGDKYPGLDKALYELGWAKKSQDKNTEALIFFARLANEHPESPFAGEAYFHVAEDQYDKKQFAEAVKIYTLAKQKASSEELGEKATYKLGWSNFQLKQYEPALAEFSEQLTKFGKGPLVADAIFMKAECLFRQDKFKEAWPVYQEAFKQKYTSPAMEVLVLLHGGQSASQLKQYDQAISLLTSIPSKFPETPYLAETFYELGAAKQNAKRADEAAKDYTTAAEKSRGEVGARARFMLGELYFEQKNFVEAIREFQRAMYGYGGDAAAPETKNWQAKSGFEAGRCAEVQIGSAKDAATKTKSIEDAKKFYGYVVEKHPSHELAAEAKKRLDVVGKL